MVSAVDVVGLLVILLVNGGVAALLTRFFRVRLDTRWGPVVYTVLVGPVVLVLLVLLLSGLLGLGPNLGNAGLVVGLTVVLPMSLGVAFDYLWMPAPEDVDLPAEYRAGN